MPASEQPVPSVWTRQRRQREQPALSREHIVSEAIRLLDAEGNEALTMRRLGSALGAGATSLYRHVANRDELIELVVDEVYGEIEVPDAAGRQGWRQAATVCAHSVRAMILRHPWIASVLGGVGLSYLGPNVMRLNERMVAVFEAGGFPPEESSRALGTVIAYVIGMGINEAAWLTVIARSGQTEREWTQALRPSIEQAARDHPRLREQVDDYLDRDPKQARDHTFTYGLERVLDGLDVRRGSAP